MTAIESRPPVRGWSRPGRAEADAPRSRGIGRFFSLRSLRVRLLLAVLAIDALGVLMTGAVIVLKARTATSLEIASSMQLAEMLVSDTIRLLKDAPAPVLLKSLDLHFQQLRHVRIAVVDVAGRPVEALIDPQMQATQNASAADAPDWFARLVSPAIAVKEFPVVVDGQSLGAVTVRSEPSDEVGEAWNYAYAISLTMLLLNIPFLVLLFLLFGRLLAPLSRLGQGLRTIAAKNYAVRLPPPSLLELATITDFFNGMASSLAEAQVANGQLHRKLLSAQDDERRKTALDLHDEVGPCLFALDANATSITHLTRSMEDSRLHERAEDLIALVGRLQGINRRVLDRLRPMAFGQMSLADSLQRVFLDFQASKTRLDIEPPSSSWRVSYGRLVDLTIYRCVQEGLTNAVRHACATRIVLALDDVTLGGHEGVRLRIEDDGRGFVQPARVGLGLSGMRERVEALNGSFELRSSPAGTIISIHLPLESEAVAADGSHLRSDLVLRDEIDLA